MNQFYKQDLMFKSRKVFNKRKIARKVEEAKDFIKNNKAKCLFALILAGLIITIPSACSSNDRKFKNFELVDAVALDAPVSKTRRLVNVSGEDRYYVEEWEEINSLEQDKQPSAFYFDDEVVVFESKVPVDVNNDGERDLWLHIAVRDNNKNNHKKGANYEIDPYQSYALNNIQKGTKLVLEGVVKRDIIHEDVITDVIYPGNGTTVLDSRTLIDYERGASYIDMQNLVAIDGAVLKEPMNKNNRKIIDERFFSNQR
jgi:hypothetical protein